MTTSAEPSADPRPRVGARYIGGLAVSSLGMWMALYTPVQVLLAQQLATITPTGKESALGLVTGLGALVALVVSPLAGALSDHTRSRFGPRRPWVAGGAVVGAAGLLFLFGQSSVAGVALGWAVVQGGLAAMLAGLVAEVPDRVPVGQRGIVSAWLGATQPIATLAGTVLVTVLITGGTGYAALAALLLLATVPFLLTPRDTTAERPSKRFRPGGFLRSLLVDPRRYPDFGYAWLTRLLFQLGNATSTVFLLYFLRDEIHYERLFPGHRAEQGLLLLILIYSAGIVLSAFLCGWVSDRLGRRKVLVSAAGLTIAAASVVLILWPTWQLTLVSAALLGVGYGGYVSVDQALITQVLPDATTRGKDLGVINIANALSHVLGPTVAAVMVTSLGGYPALFAFSAVVALLGAVLVHRIKSVA
ncbi:MFS transporter [Amycolatopsis sp. H20-H5]|uniref:MFS transporter n=1 Tax=Amycolatopsis sp. H20-H5 TaxID=3046309 RepID=UPI002DBB83B7|nr:MFS transporter [Amycolatopsis sp. H20-H5]MEC3978209.1 MFS transporter [Amycolatopsis sp. H20-H5]